MKTTKKAQADRAEAIDKLRSWFPKGSTIYTRLESTSKSGMSRVISISGYLRTEEGGLALALDGEPARIHPNYLAGLALNWPTARGNRDGIKVSGCGMDMGFDLVCSLAHIIHGDGYALKQQWL